MKFSLSDLLRADFRTSKSADGINNKFLNLLGLSYRYAPARLAIARSLSISEKPDLSPIEEDIGKSIKGENLFGSGIDLATWVTLIVEHSEKPEITKREFQNLVAAHWHRGIHLLWEEWKNCDQEFDKFLIYLLENGGLKKGGEQRSTLVDEGTDVNLFGQKPASIELLIGDPSTDITTKEVVSWRINGKGNSPHIAIVGTLGTGKTRLATQMISEVHDISQCATLIFDMGKGDLAADQNFISRIDATVISVPGTPVPLDIFWIPEKSETFLNNAALRFRESFSCAAKSKPGGVQLDFLRDAVVRSLRNSSSTNLTEVRNTLREIYAEKNRKEDSVTSTFNDFCAYSLFSSDQSPKEFFQKSWVIDVHEAPETIQRLVVFLILDSADTYLKQLEDSAIDEEGNRAMRLMLVIDEARRVLSYQQPSLIELVRTSRSKGGAVMMISQSPDDFARQKENFMENVGLVVSFRTNASNSRILNAVFGQRVDLAALPNGVCVTRLPDKSSVRRIQAWE